MDHRRLALLASLALPIGCGAASSPPPVAGTTTAQAQAPSARPVAPPAAPPEPPKKEPPNGPEEKTPGTAEVAEPIGGGRLTQAEIRDIVLKKAELFDPCYSIGAGKSQQFAATVTIKATVGPTGVVNVAQIIKSTAKNKKVDTCVADAFKLIKFPAPQGAATSVITFPLEFSGVEEVQK
jgi:outer membrane biosynthesis protein TonB